VGAVAAAAAAAAVVAAVALMQAKPPIDVASASMRMISRVVFTYIMSTSTGI
jgi:hypothetical protein